MFESIILRPNTSREYPLDYGQMIENLFFYGKTIVHIGRGELQSLYELADVEVLEKLLQLSCLEIHFKNSHTAILNHGEILSVDSIGLANLDLEKELYEESFKVRGDALSSKKFSRKISRLLKVYTLPHNLNLPMTEEVKDDEFRKKAFLEVMNKYLPGHQYTLETIRHELEFINNLQFKIHTNLSQEEASVIKADSPILAMINTYEDLHVMAQNSAEISLPEFSSKILRMRTVAAMEKRLKSQKEIDVFNHMVFNESWALREAINKKHIHVKAILKVLEKANRYKEWLQGLDDDANLIREYMEKVEEKSILERLDFKAIRLYLFTGLSSILSASKPEYAIPATVAASTFDSLILDNISKKWKPNQFIESELRPLLKSNK